MSYKIMVVEDDLKIATLLSEYIERYGYSVFKVEKFDEVMEIFNRENPNLVLMDVNLPKFDGYYWCSKIRQKSLCPIIFISARDSDMNQIMAIESGADDYIVKPFNYEIVRAKIKSNLRRVYGEYASTSNERIVNLEGLMLYPERLELEYKENKVILSKKECELIDCLMSSYPKIVSRDVLLEKLWDDQSFVDDNTLNVNITRLRKRLLELNIENVIETVRGAGYRINISWRQLDETVYKR
ncbi:MULTISPECIES: response regulator transcription factor [Clostridium]|uniref:response regulator transcription factor n=1 Tax=Clostridium TaxID=1485 RepID=UPI000780806F|nr:MULTISPECIES: response regulator transcription factor [Clostridium]MBU5225890.1 response regulator transcription factor [Clostridium senegalense]